MNCSCPQSNGKFISDAQLMLHPNKIVRVCALGLLLLGKIWNDQVDLAEPTVPEEIVISPAFPLIVAVHLCTRVKHGLESTALDLRLYVAVVRWLFREPIPS